MTSVSVSFFTGFSVSVSFPFFVIFSFASSFPLTELKFFPLTDISVSVSIHLFFSKIDGLSNAQSNVWLRYACCFIRALKTFASQRISATVSSYDVKRKYNRNENGYIQIYQFPFQIFPFPFHFVFFCNFFVSVSVNGIKIFPLTDISVSVNVNHTVMSVPTYQISFKSKKLSVDVLTGIETGFIIRST